MTCSNTGFALCHSNRLATLREKTSRRQSPISSEHRNFSEWFQVFSNPLIASAAMDRLVHKAVKVVLEGKSYRMEEFAKRNKKSDKGKTEV